MPKSKSKSSKSRKSAHPEANSDSFFWLIDGTHIKSLFELADKLDRMSDDVFHYHVTEHRNDFSNWVADVFGKADLAKELKKVERRIDAHVTVLKDLVKELSK